jgi:hypothetical protein
MPFMQFRPFLTLTLAASALAACSSGEDAEQAEEEQAVAPEPAPATATPADPAEDVPLAEGSWQIGEDARGTTAMYGGEATEPLLSLSCRSATNTVELVLSGGGDAPDTYIVDSGGQAASLDMQPEGEQLPTMSAEIEPSAPVFQAFVREGADITISSADGEERLRVPSAPGIEQVFEGCQ